MRSILLDNLPLLVALVTLYAIARTLAWRRERRRQAFGAMPDQTRCRHQREILVRGSWSVIEFQCLQCGRVHCLGHVWFGASNHKKRSAA
jgi:hypothetical protein